MPHEQTTANESFNCEPIVSLQIGNYNPKYRCEHYDGKARVADWMRSQLSDTGVDGMSWSVVTSGPYMDMLFNVSI